MLGHCGSQKLYNTISSRFYSPNLSSLCKNYKCNINCKKYKQLRQQYSHLPPWNAVVVPWDELAVNLIGPWKIKVNSWLFTFNALTCIDHVTNFVEITRIQNKTSRYIAQQFENCWLSRYPSSNRFVFDNGGEFGGADFQQMLIKHSIHPAGTTVKNPQSNGICRRMGGIHQSVADILRVIMRTTKIASRKEANQVMDDALTTYQHTLQCAVNHTMKTSPDNLVFWRDMFVDVPVHADLVAIQNRW